MCIKKIYIYYQYIIKIYHIPYVSFKETSCSTRRRFDLGAPKIKPCVFVCLKSASLGVPQKNQPLPVQGAGNIDTLSLSAIHKDIHLGGDDLTGWMST